MPFEQNNTVKNRLSGFTGKPVLRLVVPKATPGSAGGNEKALAEKKEIKKNPSVEQKWFADHTSTIERDSN